MLLPLLYQVGRYSAFQDPAHKRSEFQASDVHPPLFDASHVEHEQHIRLRPIRDYGSVVNSGH